MWNNAQPFMARDATQAPVIAKRNGKATPTHAQA